MNVMPNVNKDTAALVPPKARVGLIIPSVNTFSEPQFNHFAPEGLGIHIARARVAGEWKRPLPEMKGEIADAAKLLSDAHPDVIVFHCTDTSMSQGTWEAVTTDARSLLALRYRLDGHELVVVHNLGAEGLRTKLELGGSGFVQVLGDREYQAPRPQTIEVDAYGYRWLRSEHR